MTTKKITVAHINVRSLQPHLESIRALIIENNFDILGISETWLFDTTPSAVLHIDGYNLIRKDSNRRGAGLAFYVRNSLNLRIKTVDTVFQNEVLSLNFKINSAEFLLSIIYRNHHIAFNIFLDELEALFSDFFLRCDRVVVLGDFNVNLLIKNDPMTVSYLNCLEEIGVVQLIDEPTRRNALLDHILVSGEAFIRDSGVVGYQYSDHDAVYCSLNTKGPSAAPRFITCRNYASLDIESLVGDPIFHNLEGIYRFNNVNDKVNIFNFTIISLFDTYAPLKKIRVTKPYTPWVTDTVRLMMSLRD